MKTKAQISFAVTQLISTFVFATRIVQFLLFLNPKFQASSHLLCLYSSVCVGPGRKPKLFLFSCTGSNNYHWLYKTEHSEAKTCPRGDMVHVYVFLDLLLEFFWGKLQYESELWIRSDLNRWIKVPLFLFLKRYFYFDICVRQAKFCL